MVSKKNTSAQQNNQEQTDETMRPEYDFSSGKRGKHHKDYHTGHQVKIHRSDGSVIIQNFTLEEGVIYLEPDVKTYFPDSESVNRALRGLIALVPKK